MRYYLLLFVVLLLTSVCSASDTIPTFQYERKPNGAINLRDRCGILLDPEEEYSLEDVMNRRDLVFSSSNLGTLPPFPFVVWNRVRLTNLTAETRHDFFIHYIYSDSIWL